MEAKITGKFIRELRNEKKMSQETLASKVMVTRQAVSNWEVGKAFPESGTLLELSKLFGVTINELLLGERYVEEQDDEEDEKFKIFSQKLLEEYSKEFDSDYKKLSKTNVKRVIEEKEELERIALEFMDKYNRKSRRLRKSSRIFISIIAVILLIFFAYYFIVSYNTIHVFKISGQGENFFTNNGVMINTKQRSYIRLGKLRSFEDKEIENVKLYYLDNNNKEKVLYNDEQSDILLTDFYGYNEFYTIEELEYIEKNLFIEITYDNANVETFKLEFEKDFSNNVLAYYEKRKEHIVNEDEDSYDNLTKEIIKLIREKGNATDDGFEFKITDEDKTIEFYCQEENIIITVNMNNLSETWTNLIGSNTIIYRKVDNEEEKDYQILSDVEDRKLSKKEKQIYDEMKENIYKYLIS